MANGTSSGGHGQNGRLVLDKSMLVPVGLVVAIVLTCVSAVLYFKDGQNLMRQQQLEYQIEINKKVDQLTWEFREFKRNFEEWKDEERSDRWRKSANMKPWRDLLEALNPEVRVPGVDVGEQ